MDVSVRGTGQVEVDDMIDVRNVETSGSDVRGDEHGVLAGFEPDHGSVGIVLCERLRNGVRSQEAR
jgi:hypothetical protein